MQISSTPVRSMKERRRQKSQMEKKIGFRDKGGKSSQRRWDLPNNENEGRNTEAN